ncbi:hypothetical protein F511_41988 [Dorcoceras hygrometricum]|uniref:Uncharacterized protein n=1 Tax=Dorcoceras hygrometricum TaxID=472368 RepID=A0A2Z7BX30_9LAMI|nr:hypothetical protein F511_41988 [Dorcoceras hygrometricum]
MHCRVRDYYLRCEVPCFIGREHCDVLSMQIDSDLVIYRTTLLRTFQVVTICRVDKSEVLVVLISPHDSKLTLAMSLFDLQDVCIAIGSLATLDLPMVVDMIGIYGLKGPYCTLTTTDWFLQALTVIPRGSWGDVARRFTMIRWVDSKANSRHPPSLSHHAAAAAAVFAGKLVSGQLDVENPFVLISSGILVQPDKGVSDLVVDRIGVNYRNLPRRAGLLKSFRPIAAAWNAAPSHARWHAHARASCCAGEKRFSAALVARFSAALVALFSAALIGRLGRAGSALLGRAHRAPRPRLSRASAAPVADVGRPPAAPMRTGCATSRKEAPLSLRAGREGAPHVDAPWRTLARDCAAHVAAARVASRRAISMVAPSAGRPLLRRVSGDVVTAGLNSSRG